MGIAYNTSIVSDGLVYAIDAANSRSYSGSGITVNGLISGFGGSLVNGTGFSSANNGSFYFDGTNDYIDCGNILDSPTDLTIIVWHRYVSGSLPKTFVAKLVSYQSGPGWGFYYNLSRLNFLIQTNGSNYREYGTYNAIGLGWQHSAVSVVNQVPVAFYMSGIGKTFRISQTSGTPTSISNSVNLRIGRNESNDLNHTGGIAQVQIYNRALSATEILQNYNATKGRYGL
jgi:hypothetical protein